MLRGSQVTLVGLVAALVSCEDAADDIPLEPSFDSHACRVVEIAPPAATLAPGGTEQFSATVLHPSQCTPVSVSIAWSATGGTVQNDGLYTAGAAGGDFVVIASVGNGRFADTAEVAITGDPAPPPPDTTPPPPARDTDVAIALIDMADSVTYLGFEGGLYPGGANAPPVAHTARRSSFDASQPFGLASLSMSNGRQEWCGPAQGSGVGPQNCTTWSFVGQADTLTGINPSMSVINGAQGGMDAIDWISPGSRTWDVVDQGLRMFGLGPSDLRVFWVKQANAGPSVSLPDANADAFTLLGHLGDIARAAKSRYPNLSQMFFSSRIWSCRQGGLNGEPFAYEGGYAVKWLIEAQIRQLDGGAVDPIAGDLSLEVAPWIAWGRYLWADGNNASSEGTTWSSADLETDCTHPSQSGEQKVGRLLLEFFSSSELTRDWFMAE